ncbi:ATP-binding protein [Bartonella sp. DGB1]|uniref:sensor histidine kinase n=1 Tax=Bartonella sp. DGB1 TaxID=3239807 RepID=UPI003526A1CF
MLIIFFILVFITLYFGRKYKKLLNIINVSQNLFLQKAELILIWNKIPSLNEKPYIFGKYNDSLKGLQTDILQIWQNNKKNFDVEFIWKQTEFNLSFRKHRGIFCFYLSPKQSEVNFNNNNFYKIFEELCYNLPLAVWIGKNNKIAWANNYYKKIAHKADSGVNIIDLWGDKIKQALQQNNNFNNKIINVIAGERKTFDVAVNYLDDGLSVGHALDITQQEILAKKLHSQNKDRFNILDQLSTAIAIFDEQQKLIFYNHAFAQVWQLDISFLETLPDANQLLDNLLLQEKLSSPIQWRQLLEPSRNIDLSNDTKEDIWNFPDGRILRVVNQRSITGENIWLFDNLTQQLEIEMQYNDLIKAQGETLDNLTEGIVVFAADGLLKLANNKFAEIWKLDENLSIEGVHITEIAKVCNEKYNIDIWEELIKYIVGGNYIREIKKYRLELTNNLVYDISIVPLPNGQTMITFVDITDSINIERALQEKNNALQSADRLRNDFVHHVSYELRSPLTNIIGFSEMLEKMTDPLTEKQKKYLDYIKVSSDELLNLVNDILDLARIDAGLLQLDLEEVSILTLIKQVNERLKVKLTEKNINLIIETKKQNILAKIDKKRYQQIILALLTNAISHSSEHSKIIITIDKNDGNLILKITDNGSGILTEHKEEIFKPFQSYGRYAGSGLGLTIVNTLVKLHGGQVIIQDAKPKGTSFICVIPDADQQKKEINTENEISII